MKDPISTDNAQIISHFLFELKRLVYLGKAAQGLIDTLFGATGASREPMRVNCLASDLGPYVTNITFQFKPADRVHGSISGQISYEN